MNSDTSPASGPLLLLPAAPAASAGMSPAPAVLPLCQVLDLTPRSANENAPFPSSLRLSAFPPAAFLLPSFLEVRGLTPAPAVRRRRGEETERPGCGGGQKGGGRRSEEVSVKMESGHWLLGRLDRE